MILFLYFLKMEEKKINIITLGESSVGKTCIIKRIAHKKFDGNEISTIGIDHYIIKRDYQKKNLTLLLHFIDTVGQEKFASLTNSYIRDSHIILLVFDNIKTLNVIKERWYEYYIKNANVENSRFILIGNKSDLFGNKREEIIREGDKFSEKIDSHFITCSAKSSDNIDNLERYIITEAKRFIDGEEMEKNSTAAPSINTSPNNVNSFHLEEINQCGFCRIVMRGCCK